MKLINTLSIIATSMIASLNVAQADTLENMERQRAVMLEALLSPTVSFEQRVDKVEAAKIRLIDLERLVIRDDTLVQKNTPTVRQAFSNYDLTFLVHASAESSRSVVDHWLNELGINTDVVLNLKKGRR